MKQLYFFIACLFFTFAVQAEKRPKSAGLKMLSSKGALQLKFHKNISREPLTDSVLILKDSVLIIFDRFDHTGAGVVYQVFYENKNHSIVIPAIPEGKYYVTIQCLGIHRDRVETVVKIKSKKRGILNINQDDSEEFSKDKVVIPAYRPDFMNLWIAKAK